MAPKNKVYTFDAVNHIHMIGGMPVPGITTVLSPLHDFSTVNPHTLKAAAEYGTAVHRMIELYCLDGLDEESLDDTLRPTLVTFKEWLKEQKIQTSDIIVEVPMGEPNLLYGGIPDLILDGKLIVEIKTRKVNMLCDAIQTAAQEHLWKVNGGQRIKEYERRVLYLSPDGEMQYVKVNHKQAWPRFRHLLDNYYSTKEIEKWRIAI